MELFGTDGIRDRAGEGRLAPETVVRVGRALARFARRRTGGRAPLVALGRDPRPSGPALTEELAQGLGAEGALVTDLGMLPTPAMALAAAAWGYDLTVMVSASHNPAGDNGIKPFTVGGRKLSVEEEREVEAEVKGLTSPLPLSAAARSVGRGAATYVGWTSGLLVGDSSSSLVGSRLVVDLAAGAVSATAPAVLKGLGIDARLLNPAGSRPINDACGSEHPEAWLAEVKAARGDGGLAFDGDGDRVLVADAGGALLDGDDLLAILAEDYLALGALPGRAVVATVMSNLGLEERLRALSVRLERTPVGDRNVAERMRATGADIGGEASGHVVLARPLPDGGSALIGDALVAGVRVLQAARRLGRTLAELRAQRPRYPQVLRNVRMRERRPLETWAALQQAIRAEESRLGGRGRVLVRYSGTEPLLRLMVEGKDPAEVEASVTRLEQAARAE